MKLTRPPGVTACPGRGEQGAQDSRNNRLRPEKFPWKGFRTGVRLSPPPPNKNRNFDTMRIKVAVLSCATKALIPRGFWLLSAPAVARQSESLPPAQYAKALGSSRLSFVLWVSFHLWTIVCLPNANNSNSIKHVKTTENLLKTAAKSAIIKMAFYTSYHPEV